MTDTRICARLLQTETKCSWLHSGHCEVSAVEAINMCMNPHICNAKTSETKCSECQNAVRRQVKRSRNNYRAHGPCQTQATREYGRKSR